MQLNLYEQRFHELFDDVLNNHHGIVGMGLLAGGTGMITTLPLCEVESFTRFGYDDSWVDTQDGMGNGSIIVTIRAVGRAKIVEGELVQEEPFMKACVVEILDEDISIKGGGLKEKSGGDDKLQGELEPVALASLVAGNIESLMISVSSMEHRLNELKEKEDDGDKAKSNANGKQNEVKEEEGVMNRRLVNAQLEALFMQDTSEGVDDTDDSTMQDVEDDDDEEEEGVLGGENGDRMAQFREAFMSAKECCDYQGYVIQPTAGSDTPSTDKKNPARSPKDLTAISWACFCTGEKDNMQQNVFKIQALDMTSPLQRLHLGAALMRMEKKKLQAKLSLVGLREEDGSEDDEP